MEALGINLGYLLVQIFNFIILLAVLRAWAYKPILKLLEDRKQRIAQGLEDARVAAEARANAEREAAKIIADAQAQAAQRVREATERAEQAANDVRLAADAEAARIKQGAAEDAVLERNRVLGELRNQVAALSMAAANKLIGEALDEKRQRALIEEFFSGVRAGKITVVDPAEASGEQAEVVSALPLTDKEQSAVKKDLKGVSSVAFKVDPTILGGLVVRVGDKVLDGSVAGKLEGLRASLR
jgi:F-type H+-transporting ATPase subunit b